MLLATRGLMFPPAAIDEGRGIEQEALYTLYDERFDAGGRDALAIACIVWLFRDQPRPGIVTLIGGGGKGTYRRPFRLPRLRFPRR